MRGIYGTGMLYSFPPVLCWREGRVEIVIACIRVHMVWVSKSSVGVPLSRKVLVLAASGSQKIVEECGTG